jgi:transmembrane sensor
MESNRQIEDRAAAWLVQRDRGGWTQSDQDELTAWLRADSLHRVAYLRLEAGWERSARLKALAAGRDRGDASPASVQNISPYFDRRLNAGAAANTVRIFRSGVTRAVIPILAAVAATVLAATVLLSSSPQGERFATPVGSVSAIPLRDGSQITLNTASKVRVRLTDAERRIVLDAGEAFFDVAQDPTRPFVVDAGNKRVVAVGTKFSVRRDGANLEVVVTSGRVRVESQDGDSYGNGADLLLPGAVAHIAHDSMVVVKKTPREAENALSWRNGFLTFDETPLADVVAEFNRYTTHKVVIRDPKLAAIHINGKFRSTNADDFILLLRNGFGIHAHEDGDVVTLAEN